MAGKADCPAGGTLKEEMKLTNDTKKKNAINALIDHVASATTQFMEDVGMPTSAAEELVAPPAPPVKEEEKKDEPKVEPASVAASVTSQGVKSPMGPKIAFDAAKGKWTVAHSNFQQPMLFASKTEAEQVALALRANDVPAVEYDGDKKEFSVMHRDWEGPVKARTPEEAQAVVASKLIALGEAEPVAQEEAKKLVEQVVPAEPKKEEAPVTASVKVTAEMKQNMKGTPDSELVAGGPKSDEGAKSGPKGEMPTASGKVKAEGLAKDVLPKSDFSQSLKSEMDLGHAKGLAAKSEGEIKRLMQADGFRKEMIKMASTDQGLELAEQFMDLTNIVGLERMAAVLAQVEAQVLPAIEGKKKTSKRARKYISHKMKRIHEEESGKPKDERESEEQQVAKAMAMARKEYGADEVPEAKA